MLQRLRIVVDVLNPYSNLIIAIATVFIAILTYTLANMATEQTNIATRALELNSRPYISIHPIADTIFAQVGQRMRVGIQFNNFGGSPADVRYKGVIIHSVSKLPSLSLASAREERDSIFPREPDRRIEWIYSPSNITAGQFDDITAGTGYIYVWVLVQYGTYHTEICAEMKLLPHPPGHKGITFSQSESLKRCDDPDSNSAN